MSLLKNIFRKKETPVKSYEDFWDWFRNNERSFFNAVKQHKDIENEFFSKLSPKLDELKAGFFYLVGMSDDNIAELIITVDGMVKNFVFAEELVNAAPQLAGWKFTAHKQASDIENISIEMGGNKFHKDNLGFYANDIPSCPDEIDITIVHHDLNEQNRKSLTNGVYIF